MRLSLQAPSWRRPGRAGQAPWLDCRREGRSETSSGTFNSWACDLVWRFARRLARGKEKRKEEKNPQRARDAA